MCSSYLVPSQFKSVKDVLLLITACLERIYMIMTLKKTKLSAGLKASP